MSGVYMEELEYDIQELFIDGYEAYEIASNLNVSLGKVVSVLTEFGIREETE